MPSDVIVKVSQKPSSVTVTVFVSPLRLIVTPSLLGITSAPVCYRDGYEILNAADRVFRDPNHASRRFRYQDSP